MEKIIEDDRTNNVSKRRLLLKRMGNTSVLIGSIAVISKQWSTPIINSVILPSHAQTSDPVETPEPEVECQGIEDVTFLEPGMTEYQIPEGVILISVQVVGGSGGGGGSGAANLAVANPGDATSGAGGSGSSGEIIVSNDIAVEPGMVVDITVGAGGVGGDGGIEQAAETRIFTGGGGGLLGGMSEVSVGGVVVVANGGNGGGGGGGSLVGVAEAGANASAGGAGGMGAGLGAEDGGDGEVGGRAANGGAAGAPAVVGGLGLDGEDGQSGSVLIAHCEQIVEA